MQEYVKVPNNQQKVAYAVSFGPFLSAENHCIHTKLAISEKDHVWSSHFAISSRFRLPLSVHQMDVTVINWSSHFAIVLIWDQNIVQCLI